MIKKLVIISIILFALVLVIITQPFAKEEDEFSLIDQIEERQLMGVFNMTEFLADAKEISTKLKTFGLAEQYFTEVTETMKQSGLRLDNVYYSIESRNTLKRSLYFEIVDRPSLESTFRNFSLFFDLEQNEKDTCLYIAKENNIAIRIESEWVEVIQGDLSNLTHQPKMCKTVRSLLHEKYFYILNTGASSQLDSLEYIAGNYQYDSTFLLSGTWTYRYSTEHPVKPNKDSLYYYPTNENLIEAFLNIDRTAWDSYHNDYLKERLERIADMGLFDYASWSKNWNGQFAMNYGGDQFIKQTKVITEFDEFFNQVERTVETLDTIKDVGVTFSTTTPEYLHKEIVKQSNIEQKNGATYIGLLPPLSPRYLAQHLVLSSGNNELEVKSTGNNVSQFVVNTPQLSVKFNAFHEGSDVNFNFSVVPKTDNRIKVSDLINLFL